MSNHETERSSQSPDGITLLRSDELQPQHHTTPESVRAASDVIGHEVDKLALGKGPSPELAEALAREQTMQLREDQLEAYRTGGTAIDSFKLQAAEAQAQLAQLYEYADGKTEGNEAVVTLMQDRIKGINDEIDGYGGDLSTESIRKTVGDVAPGELHKIQERTKELSKLKTTQDLKKMRDAPPTTEQHSEAEIPQSEGDRLVAAVEDLQLVESLDKTPGQYHDGKGAALVYQTMQQLGVEPAAMADFARDISSRYTTLRAEAQRLYPDKSETAQMFWAQNQLVEGMHNSKLWEQLAPNIEAQGDELGGKGTTMSREKVITGFLTFAQRLYPQT